MLPVDIFDIAQMDEWVKLRAYRTSFINDIREAWVDRRQHILFEKFLPAVKPVLGPLLSSFIWRRRFSNALSSKMQSEFYWAAHNRWNPEEMDAVNDEEESFLCVGIDTLYSRSWSGRVAAWSKKKKGLKTSGGHQPFVHFATKAQKHKGQMQRSGKPDQQVEPATT